ncbi:flagella biosynthesis regulatory protein FliZ [Entomohabitans teleogrylli]|uniref:flagella biosynthesis regulatory protein FliZ n=1 Tax=Entomohabitans teleogrylli TaxID=1384589 RepID=UPI00073DA2F2|nr:flagella biosynthesis regulatory protein FliZ [Entomohabitans teleogrylli]
MTRQQARTRPLSRYLKDFKLAQTQCAHCRKPLQRVTLVHNGQVIKKNAIPQLERPMDDHTWQEASKEWSAMCRFCSDLWCHEQESWFDILGFKQYLFEQTNIRISTIHEYVVRLRRLGNDLSRHQLPQGLLLQRHMEQQLEPWLPATSTDNYRIALRKYAEFLDRSAATPESIKSTSDIY